MRLLDIEEPGISRKNTAIGIDLGTTNSLAAIADSGVPLILEGEGRALLPSVVAYGKDGKIIVGEAAKNLVDDKNFTVIFSIKRRMGDAASRLEVWNSNLTPVEISAEILKALKIRAEKALGHEVTQGVITVPAYFDDAARSATKDAARLAGLEVLRLINEPTAAALSYGLDKGAEGIYAVYDLGGGTFDISLLKMEKGIFQVLATAGDTELGGDDFDYEIAKANNISLHEARKMKESLGGNATPEFEKIIMPYIERTLRICEDMVEDSGLRKEEIKGVVLVGGSTRIPLIKRKLRELFGTEPLADIDPDKIVALGAAIQAEALTQGSENLLLDVTPLSLGLETMGGLVERIIQRNTPIPVSAMQEFTTYQDGQSMMKIHVVQGEREMVNQCRPLAEFILSGIPPMKAGIARIKVTFAIDADGLLTVSAMEETTGAVQNITVKPSYGLAEEEIEQMLRDSMENARSDITERLLAESRVEADLAVKTIEDAIRIDGDLLQVGERENLEERIAEIKKLAAKKDRDSLDFAVAELNKMCADFAERRMNRSLTKALAGKDIRALEKKLS